MAREPSWQRDNGQYIPYPATWLRQGGWENEVGDTVIVSPYTGQPRSEIDEWIEASWSAEMTENETKVLLATIQTAYPNYHVPNKTFAVNLWLEMLGGYDYADVEKGLKAYMATDTSGFAPSMGQLIAAIGNVKGDGFMGAEEAWLEVRRACRSICQYDDNYTASAVFSRLPTELKEAVGDAHTLNSYGQMDIQDRDRHEKPRFMAAYKAVIDKRRMNRAAGNPAIPEKPAPRIDTAKPLDDPEPVERPNAQAIRAYVNEAKRGLWRAEA